MIRPAQFALGMYFAKMASRKMFRSWLSKRDSVSDKDLDSHILTNYVRNHARVAPLLAEFKAAHGN